MWTLVAIVSLLVMAAMLGFGGNIANFDPVVEHGESPAPGQEVFIDSHVMHNIDLIGMGILCLILLTNAFRMFKFIILDDKSVSIPVSIYVKKIFEFPLHLLTQKRYRDCDNRMPWLIHLILVIGYIISFVLIVVFLVPLQAAEYNTTLHVFGYIGTICLIFGCGWAIIGRMLKSEEHLKFSHHTDWAFAILLFLTAITGIFTHVLHRVGMPMAANIMYIVHMMVDIPWFILIIPFGKWSHLIYRPLAMYLAAIKEEALLQGQNQSETGLDQQAA